MIFALLLAFVLPVQADTLTPRMGINKPTIGSLGWGPKINANFDVMDTSAAALNQVNTFTGSSNTFNSPVLVKSSVNASGFFGSGAGLTSYAVVGDSDSISVTNINSLNYVGVGTCTVTLRGSRPVLVLYHAVITNSAAGSRLYTMQSTLNSAILDPLTHGNTILSGDLETLGWQEFIPSSTPGVNYLALLMRSSSATGTQTVTDVHITVVEF